MDSKRLFLIYANLGVIHLLCVFFQSEIGIYTTKPLLMLSLWLITAWLTRFRGRGLAWLGGGLAASLAGDVLLLFTEQSETFFLLGLGAFLLAHVSYIIAFLKFQEPGLGWFRRTPGWSLLPLVYLGLFWYFMWPVMPAAFAGPVVLYSLAIVVMCLAAIQLGEPWIIAGAVVFILSDTLIAYNKFYAVLPYAGIWIMVTYIIGQGLIVWGALRRFLGSGYAR